MSTQRLLSLSAFSAKTKVAIGISILVGVALIVLIAGCVLQYKRYERAYARLLPRVSEASVREAFGTPREVRQCGQEPSWDGEPVAQRVACAKELWYFSRISPEQWGIGIDQEGKVIAKYHFVSP